MAKKPKASSTATVRRNGASAKPKRENVIKRAAEEIEARFFEGAEMATETTSAETNVVLAALAAIEGPHEAKPKAKSKGKNGKSKSSRSKDR